MIRKFCHLLLSGYYGISRRRFLPSLARLETTQRRRLREIISTLKATQTWAKLDENSSYEELVREIPVQTYADYEARILMQKDSSQESNCAILCPQVVRYEPTSGSTQKRKWIPYGKKYLAEINQAAKVWLGDLYLRFPQIASGTHYWSLSWLPLELRGQTSTDDSELFPFYQRWILKQTMAVPGTLSSIESPEAAWWATLVMVVSRFDLTLVSVWSPTFWLKMTFDIKLHWPEIRETLERGNWTRHHDELNPKFRVPRRRHLKGLRADDRDFFKKLWPRLHLISTWDGASSLPWANQIRAEFPDVLLQGKGLWATEGVVSIPLNEGKILATMAHFFEFKDLLNGEIVPPWRTEAGREYQPILWTSSGMLRYPLQDRVRVTGFVKETPTLEFLGRILSADLVGEKVDAIWVQILFEQNKDWRAICLVAVRSPEPHYVLFHQGSGVTMVEEKLQGLHHYQLARQLGQLQAARSFRVRDVFEVFEKLGRSRVLGQNKVEVLIEVESL